MKYQFTYNGRTLVAQCDECTLIYAAPVLNPVAECEYLNRLSRFVPDEKWIEIRRRKKLALNPVRAGG